MADRNGYIGRAPGDSSVIVARKVYEPTGVQTDFTFNSGYTPGYCDVYLNGVRLIDEKDFTASNGSTVGLTSAAQSGDVVELVVYKAYNLGVPLADVTGNLDVTGNISASSSITAGTLFGDGSNLSGIPGVGITQYIDANSLTVIGSPGVSTITRLGATDLNVTGIITANGLVGNVTGAAITVTGQATFSSDVSIGGTLTYEDVTNVDSVGMITARSGIAVTGGQLTVGVAYSVGAAGVATAAGFVGPLTGNVTGSQSGGSVSATTGTFSQKTTVNATLEATEGLNVTAGVTTIGGNVKVGSACTITTGAVLSLQANSAPQIQLLDNNNGFDATQLLVENGGRDFKVTVPQDTIFTQGSTESMRLTSSGALGIGTLGDSTGPTSLLVARNEASGYIASFRGIHASNSAQIIIDSPADNNTRPSSIDLANAGVVKWSLGQAYASASSGAFHIATSKLQSNDNGAKVTVSTAGLVGFGTINPSTLLTLNNDSETYITLKRANANHFQVGTDNNGHYLVGREDKPIIFANSASSAYTERLRINSSGQVGINTSNPSGKLAIAVDDSSTNTLATGSVGLTLKNTDTTDNSWVSMDFNNSAGGIVGRIGAQFIDTSDKSTDLYFATREDSGSLTERLRINANGDINFYGTAGISSVKWDASANRLILKDNSYAVFGDSADLQIFHDGSHSQILDTGTGYLYIAGNSNVSIDKYSGEEMANFNADGSVQLYFNNSEKFATTNEGVNVSGMMSATAGIAVTGGMWEGAFIKAGKLSDNKTIGISTSNIFYFSTQESTTSTPNIIWNDTYPLSSKMNVGDVVTVTVISNAAAGGYSANWTIDGNAVSEQWNGGSAPSAGGSDGFDIYTLTIVRKATGTGDTGWLMFANVSNFT